MLSSIVRLGVRVARPVVESRRSLSLKPILTGLTMKRIEVPRRWSHVHYTYGMIEARVMLLLRLFDKIDPNLLKLDSRFTQDLGLDSLDLVEITAACEDEFWTEIAAEDLEHFSTPRHIIQYLCDKYDVYEHVEPVSAGKEYLASAAAAADRAHH